MGIEIAMISNAGLRAAALEVDTKGNSNGKIDDSELSLFLPKATVLLKEKKCTSQEFSEIFYTSKVDDALSVNDDAPLVQDDAPLVYDDTPLVYDSQNDVLKAKYIAQVQENEKKMSILWKKYNGYESKNEKPDFLSKLGIAGLGGGMLGAVITESIDFPTTLLARNCKKFGYALLFASIIPAIIGTVHMLNKGKDERREAEQEYFRLKEENKRLDAEINRLSK